MENLIAVAVLCVSVDCIVARTRFHFIVMFRWANNNQRALIARRAWLVQFIVTSHFNMHIFHSWVSISFQLRLKAELIDMLMNLIYVKYYVEYNRYIIHNIEVSLFNTTLDLKRIIRMRPWILKCKKYKFKKVR